MALTTHEQQSTLRVLNPNRKQASYFNVFDFGFKPQDPDEPKSRLFRSKNLIAASFTIGEKTTSTLHQEEKAVKAGAPERHSDSLIISREYITNAVISFKDDTPKHHHLHYKDGKIVDEDQEPTTQVTILGTNGKEITFFHVKSFKVLRQSSEIPEYGTFTIGKNYSWTGRPTDKPIEANSHTSDDLPIVGELLTVRGIMLYYIDPIPEHNMHTGSFGGFGHRF